MGPENLSPLCVQMRGPSALQSLMFCLLRRRLEILLTRQQAFVYLIDICFCTISSLDVLLRRTVRYWHVSKSSLIHNFEVKSQSSAPIKTCHLASMSKTFCYHKLSYKNTFKFDLQITITLFNVLFLGNLTSKSTAVTMKLTFIIFTTFLAVASVQGSAVADPDPRVGSWHGYCYR